MGNNIKNIQLNMAATGSVLKPLTIDFDVFTEGDEEFKQELILLMIDNMKELQQSLESSAKVFRNICHKVKSTLSMLEDSELENLIKDLEDEHLSPEVKAFKAGLFDNMCTDIIKNLEKETA